MDGQMGTIGKFVDIKGSNTMSTFIRIWIGLNLTIFARFVFISLFFLSCVRFFILALVCDAPS